MFSKSGVFPWNLFTPVDKHVHNTLPNNNQFQSQSIAYYDAIVKHVKRQNIGVDDVHTHMFFQTLRSDPELVPYLSSQLVDQSTLVVLVSNFIYIVTFLHAQVNNLCLNQLNYEYMPFSMDATTFQSLPRPMHTSLAVQLGEVSLPRIKIRDDFSHILPQWNEYIKDLDKIQGLPDMSVSTSH